MNRTLRGALCASLLLSRACVQAADSDAADLSLEDLLKTEVTTAARKSQSLQSSAAAVFVITHEDIERSGATNIPDALRMAPGVEVAKIADNRWAVSVRGFNGRFSNKLLVLVDGRSIYSPLFSGVLWESEGTMMEDIDRIEVIRGPGGSLWGANAVNGVINIITRKARDTQGSLAVAAAGSEERALGELQHGGQSRDGHYRLWAKAFDIAQSPDTQGHPSNDYWRGLRGGFRRDWSPGSGDRYTLSGEAYGGPTGDRWNVANVNSPSGYVPTNIVQTGQGSHILGRREWVQADGSEAALQSYFDYEDIDVRDVIHQKRVTFDLDFQRRSALDERNDFIWGMGYRYSADRIDTQGILQILPPRRDFTLASAFAQDEMTLVPERLRLIGGVRLEYNSFTGFDPQPNLRMLWTPSPNQSVWGAISRAVRTPSRAERDAQVELSVTPAQAPDVPLPVLTVNAPMPGVSLRPEKVDTVELGYRQQIDNTMSVDLAAFYSHYRDLRSAQMGPQSLVPGPSPYVVQVLYTNNGVSANTRGVEMSVDWRPLSWWRLQASYSWLNMLASSTLADSATEASASQLGQSAPRNQVSLRSAFNIDRSRQLDLWLRSVSRLRTVDPQGDTVPAYTTLDARYAWRPTTALELSLVGQNLLRRTHAEFTPDLLPSQTRMVERSFYLKAKYQF